MKTKFTDFAICLLLGWLLALPATAQLPEINIVNPRPTITNLPNLNIPNRPPDWSSVVLDQGFKTVWAQLPQIGRSVQVQVKEYGDNHPPPYKYLPIYQR